MIKYIKNQAHRIKQNLGQNTQGVSKSAMRKPDTNISISEAHLRSNTDYVNESPPRLANNQRPQSSDGM